MAIGHVSSWFNIDQAAIYALTADVAGATPTYGSMLLLPAIKKVEFTPDILEKELYGDGRVKEHFTRVRSGKAVVTYGQHNLDTLPVQIGGTVTDSGTTPNQKAAYALVAANLPGYFKLEWRTRQVSFAGATASSDVHGLLFKCRSTGFTFAATEEDYGLPQLNLTCLYLDSTPTTPATLVEPLIYVEERETGAALS